MVQRLGIHAGIQQHLFVPGKMRVAQEGILPVVVNPNFVFGHEKLIRVEILLFQKFFHCRIESNVLYESENSDQQRQQVTGQKSLFAFCFEPSQSQIALVIFQLCRDDVFVLGIFTEGGIFFCDSQTRGSYVGGTEIAFVVVVLVIRSVVGLFVFGQITKICRRIFPEGNYFFALVVD